jgi:hypothetical protein
VTEGEPRELSQSASSDRGADRLLNSDQAGTRPSATHRRRQVNDPVAAFEVDEMKHVLAARSIACRIVSDSFSRLLLRRPDARGDRRVLGVTEVGVIHTKDPAARSRLVGRHPSGV